MHTSPLSFGGFAVFVSPDTPGYVLPDDLPLPPEFRAKFNAWAADFFTPRNLVREGEALMDYTRNCMYVTPRTFERLKKELAK